MSTSAACRIVSRSISTRHDLTLLQLPTVRRGIVIVTTMLVHGESEQWIASDLLAALDNHADVQALGSLLNYLRRYGACAVCGVAPTALRQFGHDLPSRIQKSRSRLRICECLVQVNAANC